jgi:hypothetical protein
LLDLRHDVGLRNDLRLKIKEPHVLEKLRLSSNGDIIRYAIRAG